ncbi:MAG: GTPase [Planctomycetota bacterium]|jgi:tRNA modification GTPase
MPVDTIVAPITAAGAAERAALRLSGPRAFALAAQLAPDAPAYRPGRADAVRLDLGDGLGIDALLLRFAGPRSLTGEDVVELHVAGWPVLVTELVRRFVAAGARTAERGEFTRRAIASGRTDLARGLAVARLVAARDVEEAAAAAAVLAGGLAERHAVLRERLLDALALIEAHVDFEEDDTEAVGEADLRVALEAALAAGRTLDEACGKAVPLDGETDVALLGPPNAGKSALMLAMCPGAHTTVSPVAGTTRDMLEARMDVDGRRYRLLDGPGVDPGRAGLDGLDRRAMDLYLDNIPTGAVIVDVEDGAAPSSPAARAARRARSGTRPRVPVWNKSDVSTPPAVAAAEPDSERRLPVSALRREGLDALWSAVSAAAPAPHAPDLATDGERRALDTILPLLSEAASGPLAGTLPLVALALRDALVALDSTVAHAADLQEELLDRVFAGFCIGK